MSLSLAVIKVEGSCGIITRALCLALKWVSGCQTNEGNVLYCNCIGIPGTKLCILLQVQGTDKATYVESFTYMYFFLYVGLATSTR